MSHHTIELHEAVKTNYFGEPMIILCLHGLELYISLFIDMLSAISCYVVMCDDMFGQILLLHISIVENLHIFHTNHFIDR